MTLTPSVPLLQSQNRNVKLTEYYKAAESKKRIANLFLFDSAWFFDVAEKTNGRLAMIAATTASLLPGPDNSHTRISDLTVPDTHRMHILTLFLPASSLHISDVIS